MDKKSLLKLPKGSPEKLVLAWWLRENTTVTLRCALGERAIRRVSRRPGRKLEGIKRQVVVAIETAPQPTP